MKRLAGWRMGLFLLIAGQAAAQTPEGNPAWKSVERILGRPGAVQGSGFRIQCPRTDLNVVVDGVPVEPELVLTSEFDFEPLPKGTAVQGELVLLDSEVSPVLERLLKEGFHLTGLSHRLLNESPGIKILRLKGEGSRVHLAESLKAILALTGISLKNAVPEPDAAVPPPDWSLVEKILGPGQRAGKVLLYSFSPEPSAPAQGNEPPSFGIETTLGFQRIRGEVIPRKGPLDLARQPSSNAVAAAGRLVLKEGQTAGVLKGLQDSSFTVTSMETVLNGNAEPLILMDYWGQGDAEEMAAELKSVLEGINQGPAE